MGRAIEMEKQIYVLEDRVEKLESIVRGMTYSIDELENKSSKTKHIDIIVETKPKESDEKKKTNDEGDGKGNVKPNRGNKKNKS